MRSVQLRRGRWWRWAVLACVVALAGCPNVKLVSDYDEKLDQGVSDLEKKVERILSKIESSKADPSKSYAASDYAELKQDLNVLITRASSWDKNELTEKQLYNAGYALLAVPPMAPDALGLPPRDANQSLEARHRNSAALQDEDIATLRMILNADFQSILKLELAKKRGSSATSAK